MSNGMMTPVQKRESCLKVVEKRQKVTFLNI